MKYHVLVCSGHAETGEVIAARQTFEKLLLLLLTERFWPHGSEGSEGADLQPGDRVLFCLATKSAPAIVGDAVVASSSTPLTGQQLAETRIYLGPAMPPEAGTLTHAVALEHVAVWDEPWRAPGDDDPVAFNLAKALAGVYRTGSVRPIARETFEEIRGQRRAAEQPPPVEAAAAPDGPPAAPQPSRPMNGDITGFLRAYWSIVDFGEPLCLLSGSAAGGTAAHAGVPELICEAGQSGDLVAVVCLQDEVPEELVATFRQRLASLRENTARLGQRVRGVLLLVGAEAEIGPLDGHEIEVRHLRMACEPPQREAMARLLEADTPNLRDQAADTAPEEPVPAPEEPAAVEAPAPAPKPPPPPRPQDTASVAADFAQRCMNVPLSRSNGSP